MADVSVAIDLHQVRPTLKHEELEITRRMTRHAKQFFHQQYRRRLAVSPLPGARQRLVEPTRGHIMQLCDVGRATSEVHQLAAVIGLQHPVFGEFHGSQLRDVLSTPQRPRNADHVRSRLKGVLLRLELVAGSTDDRSAVKEHPPDDLFGERHGRVESRKSLVARA